MAECSKCCDDVRWCETVNGRKIMLDLSAKGRGLRYVIMNGKARVATEDDKRLHREMFSCHFDTCRQVLR